jgi:catechol 2,3-dioxygenase-like lactoylglutathione lyase family enzyme
MELRIVRRTDHFDAACRFWGELLGWPVTREWPADDDQGRGRIFGYGDVGRVELIEHAGVGPVDGVFVAVEHADVDELHARCLDAGVTVVRAPGDQPWGHRNMIALDPSGLEVTFFQWI